MVEHYLSYSDEVKIAKMEGKPIVALESTIISHGMPYPQNMEMAREVEGIIRTIGAIPATIAIINGQVKIGLSDEELEFIATSKEIEKVSRRDLPFIIAKNKNGATTVAATMICAEWAGIEVFVTGGIGGVHRHAERTMDISADLQELAKTNVAVVCAGIKSILDLGLTLEYLETHGVPVVGFQTEILPAFYTPTSPFKVNFKVDSSQEAAKLIRTKWDLGLSGGVVIANPIPDRDGMDEHSINQIIKIALKEAEELGISGKAVTPFLLGKVKDLTGGTSLQANISLVKNNARLGAEIALQLSNQITSSL